MGQREVPVAEPARFIFVIAEANDCFRFALRLGPVHVGGGIVNRVGAQNHQRIDLAGVERLRQIGEGPGVFGRGVPQYDGLADIAKRDVERMGE